MARGRRLLGQVVLVLAVTAGAFVGAKLGLLGTREVGASHNFSDVPTGIFYHDFVQFLVDKGITAGCAPSLFCGEAPVTRGQGAVFLKKLVLSHTMWAVVNADGTLARGSENVTSAAVIAGSQYEVIFDRNVRGCVYVASIGSPGFQIFPAPGMIEVAGRATDENGVAVQTLDANGAASPRPFHVAVHC